MVKALQNETIIGTGLIIKFILSGLITWFIVTPVVFPEGVTSASDFWISFQEHIIFQLILLVSITLMIFRIPLGLMAVVVLLVGSVLNG
ncbi:hypothetical protein [Marinoscillum sp. MHG1-6]|uniref:hypothetical protein n=1 Tax=Marinoscillum sp. MHG1-6 TaxID=2959627 RepID=UPI002156FF2F|nr:hypothetical protein [Marinoscillum sp. MHG1-6]